MFILYFVMSPALTGCSFAGVTRSYLTWQNLNLLLDLIRIKRKSIFGISCCISLILSSFWKALKMECSWNRCWGGLQVACTVSVWYRTFGHGTKICEHVGKRESLRLELSAVFRFKLFNINGSVWVILVWLLLLKSIFDIVWSLLSIIA